MYFFQQKLYCFQYKICVPVVGNKPYGKRRISRTKPVYGKLNSLEQSSNSPLSFYTGARSVRFILQPENAPEKR